MNKRQRYEEKVDFVVQWLLEFGSSTPSLLCLAMGLERKNQGHFFLSLKKSGLVKVVQNPLVKEQIYLLSPEGKARGSYLSEKAEKYYFSPSKVVMSTTIHSFSIQRAIAERYETDLPFCFQSERFLTDIHKTKRPDALVGVEGRKVALEVELTQKSEGRIYLAYRNHIDAMKEGVYESVVYVFPSESLFRSYKKRFDHSEWPLYIKDSGGKVRQELRNGEPMFASIKEGIRSRFEFYVQESY